MNFQEKISKLNKHFFYKEFTFSNTNFKPTPSDEFELADNIIWLDDMLVIFQLKERFAPNNHDSDSERKWFNLKSCK